MNSYSVEVAEPARRDALDIARYISAELSAPKAALEMVDKLDDGMRSLEANPKRHALVRDDRLAAKGYRALPVKNYLIFYKVNERKRLVDIVRILYNRRDWVNLIY
jgi:addiction module RelE/StbE family toxin